MKRTSLSPIDVLGITLGTIVILVLLGSIVGIVRGRMFNAGYSFSQGRAWWGDGAFSVGGAMRAENDEVIPAGTYTTVEVRNVAGSIDITGSGTGAVTVHSTRRGPTQGALDNVRVDIQKQGDRLVVEEKHDSGFMMRSGTVSFNLTVPPGVKVIQAHSVSGSVSVSGVSAGVDQVLSTISGSVETSAAHDLDISSTSGHLSFVSTGSTLNAHTISGSIDGTIDALGSSGSARLNSVSGSISLNAYAALDAALSLHSVSGSVSCGFPVTIAEEKRNNLRGKVGNGSANLDIGTVSGSISINKK
jgi:DUF4097 and DUF4098 domain-containing protein YvlB